MPVRPQVEPWPRPRIFRCTRKQADEAVTGVVETHAAMQPISCGEILHHNPGDRLSRKQATSPIARNKIRLGPPRPPPGGVLRARGGFSLPPSGAVHGHRCLNHASTTTAVPGSPHAPGCQLGAALIRTAPLVLRSGAALINEDPLTGNYALSSVASEPGQSSSTTVTSVGTPALGSFADGRHTSPGTA